MGKQKIVEEISYEISPEVCDKTGDPRAGNYAQLTPTNGIQKEKVCNIY